MRPQHGGTPEISKLFILVLILIEILI